MRPLRQHYLHHSRLLWPPVLSLPQLQVSQQSQQVGRPLWSPRLLRALPSSLPTETGNTTEVTMYPITSSFDRGEVRRGEERWQTIQLCYHSHHQTLCELSSSFIISFTLCVAVESNILKITQFRKLFCKKAWAENYMVVLDQDSRTVTLNTVLSNSNVTSVWILTDWH